MFPVQVVLAADTNEIVTNLGMQDYFIIFFIGLLYLCSLIVIIQRIFRRERSVTPRSGIFARFGAFLAFLLIVIGSILIISFVLILIALAGKITIFYWLIALVSNYTNSLPTGIIVIGAHTGIIVMGAIGIVIFIFGLYSFISLRGNPLYSGRGTSKLGQLREKEHEIRAGPELSNLVVTYKVLDKNDDSPVPDVRVVLKKINGEGHFTKFTDFNGEVTFTTIQGYISDYYAHVEGDEERQKYRIFLKKSYGERR